MLEQTYARRLLLKMLGKGIVTGTAMAHLPIIGLPIAKLMAQETNSTKATAKNLPPIRIGHYVSNDDAGKWSQWMVQKTINAINQTNGVSGRKLKLVTQNFNGKKAQAETLMKNFATKLKCDLVISGFDITHAEYFIPYAEQFKLPFFSCAGSDFLVAGKASRYVFQLSINDEYTQIASMVRFITQRLGRKVTVIFADNTDNRRHILSLNKNLADNGAQISQYIDISNVLKKPLDAAQSTKLFAKYFHRIPIDTQVIYYLLPGDYGVELLRELTESYAGNNTQAPHFFWQMADFYGLPVSTPDFDVLEGSYFGEIHPLNLDSSIGKFEKKYRQMIGLDEFGQLLSANGEPAPLASYQSIPYGKLSAIWSSLFAVRNIMQNADYHISNDRRLLIEALETIKNIDYALPYPQGRKIFNGRLHQVFARHYVTQRKTGSFDIIHKSDIHNYYSSYKNNYSNDDF